MRNRRDRSFRLVALGAAGALGVAAVYFLDPVFGPRRRRVAKDWLSATVRQVFVSNASEPDADARPEDVVDATPADLSPPVPQPVPEPTLSLPAEPAVVLSAAPARAADVVASLSPERHEPPQRVVVTPPRRRRLSVASLTALAVVAALGAVSLGSWALLSDDDASRSEAGRQADQQVSQAITLLADPQARRIPVQNSNGAMVFVVGSDGRAVLILDEMQRAPEGKTYQAWVIPPDGEAPVPAGVFVGGETAVPLRLKVPMGATVAVTVEAEGGVQTPTQQPRLVAKRG